MASEDHGRVERVSVTVQGRRASVWVGGAGPALLLVHGGWAGAEMHWSRVWSPLAERFRVVAPDLPGLGDVSAPALPSVRAYASWLVDLLDALGVERASLVGCSFGGSVVYSLAGRHPRRCDALVMVSGVPMPGTPAALSLAARLPGARPLASWLLRRLVYTRANVALAFADVSRAPSTLHDAVARDWASIVPRYADILIAGDGPPAPTVTPLLVFGARDRLFGTTPRDAARLRDRMTGARLVVIDDAGHFPQVERPARFVEVVTEHVAGRRAT